MKIYAVVDKKAKQIVCVFSSVNDEFAKRSFEMLLTEPQDNVYNLFPSQFALMSVAELNFDGVLDVRKAGNEVLEANGFKGDSFSVSEYVSDGDEMSASYLEKMRKRRFSMVQFMDESIAKTEENLKKINSLVDHFEGGKKDVSCDSK